MTDIQTILKMIETVDPNDKEKMDEIDARIWCVLHEARFKRLLNKPEHYDIQRFSYYQGSIWGQRDVSPPHQYTRSRDALKTIRPNNLYYFANPYSDKTWKGSSNFWDDEDREDFESPKLPTEELAELHAIVQAYEYERNKNNE